LARPGNQYFASLSPDGAWLSYMSDETGSWEVYVQSYPDLGRRRKVSVAGGEEPIWSPKGDRLFYRYGTTWYVAAVDRRTGVVGLPVEFISGRFANIPGFSYSVPPDGETASHIRILRDLASELHKAERRR
jgi:Tol biopolymer transport system component